MDANTIIAAFGGITKTAWVVGCSRNSVGHWPVIGIPLKHWRTLIAAAEARGIEGVTFDVLDAIHEAAPRRVEARARRLVGSQASAA